MKVASEGMSGLSVMDYSPRGLLLGSCTRNQNPWWDSSRRVSFPRKVAVQLVPVLWGESLTAVVALPSLHRIHHYLPCQTLVQKKAKESRDSTQTCDSLCSSSGLGAGLCVCVCLRCAHRTIGIAESLARVIAAIRITSVRWRSSLAPKRRKINTHRPCVLCAALRIARLAFVRVPFRPCGTAGWAARVGRVG